MIYTQETIIFPRLNAVLRARDDDALTPFLPYMKLLMVGLSMLPLKLYQVYRGIKLDLHDEYAGLGHAPWTWWPFTSTTVDPKVLQTPVFLGDEGRRTLFNMKAFGVDIMLFSAHQEEGEILLLPGCRYITVSSRGNMTKLTETETFKQLVGSTETPVLDTAADPDNRLSEFI